MERVRSPGVRGQLAAGRRSAGLCYMSHSVRVSTLPDLNTNTQSLYVCLCICSMSKDCDRVSDSVAVVFFFFPECQRGGQDMFFFFFAVVVFY